MYGPFNLTYDAELPRIPCILFSVWSQILAEWSVVEVCFFLKHQSSKAGVLKLSLMATIGGKHGKRWIGQTLSNRGLLLRTIMDGLYKGKKNKRRTDVGGGDHGGWIQ